MGMHAVIVTEYGSSPETREVPAPTPHAGQALIKVLAAGMNPMDRAIAAGEWQSFMPATFPMVLGADVAGTVERVGDGPNRFAAGEAVMGQLLVPPLGSSGHRAPTPNTSPLPQTRPSCTSRRAWILPSRQPPRRQG